MNEFAANQDQERDRGGSPAAPAAEPSPVERSLDQQNTRAEKMASTIFFVLAVLVAFWFRFHEIGLKPFHHDEGVNWHFLHNLSQNGEYRYDPTNYHGPTLYYLTLIPLRIFGDTDLALRFWPAAFGALSVALLWFLRRQLGRIGTPVAAFCLAASPGLVYFSRDFIHEMPFGCFSLAMVIGAWKYLDSRKFVWLFVFSLSAGLLFASKETAVINVAVLIMAVFCAAGWEFLNRPSGKGPGGFAGIRELVRDLRAQLPSLDHSLSALIIFAFIYIFFYSSLFTHWQGVIDFMRSILHWTTERSNRDHVHSFDYYFGILFKYELPLLIGTILGFGLSLRRGTRFWLFMGAWAVGTTLAYSIIPYKTPWLMVSFLVPMAIVTGYAAERIYQVMPPIALRLLWLAVLVMAVTASWQLAARVNFIDYEDNNNTSGYFVELGKTLGFKPYLDGQYGYVYAQTVSDIFNLAEAVKGQADRLGTGARTGIYIAAPSSDYWPLPWVLRNFPNTDFSGSLNVAADGTINVTQSLIIANLGQEEVLRTIPGWRPVGRPYAVRPGVELMVYVRDENARPSSPAPEAPETK
ncbi:MAG TPA: flippase activity-associated protein Agl23 [Blastocatellia bacterium]|nr:flippase activity-associated protein Agl23 [Blastocatellia bacterium]